MQPNDLADAIGAEHSYYSIHSEPSSVLQANLKPDIDVLHYYCFYNGNSSPEPTMKAIRYLVTGATGFVGSHVVERLSARGDFVQALIRDPATGEARMQRRGEIRMDALTDTGDLSAVVSSVDVIIHCAEALPALVSEEKAWDINVGVTERLLSAAVQADLKRLVYISSAAVYGQVPAPVPENAPKKPATPYGKSKWAAEEIVWHYHTRHSVPVVVLRPCTILGRGNSWFWHRVLSRRVLLLPDGGRCLFDLVYISDLVDAVLAAAVQPAALGNAYNITNGETHSIRDILEACGAITGRSPRILPLSRQGLVLAQRAMKDWFKGRGNSRQVDWALLFGMLDMDHHYDINAARLDLEYAPLVGLIESLRRALVDGAQSGTKHHMEHPSV